MSLVSRVSPADSPSKQHRYETCGILLPRLPPKAALSLLPPYTPHPQPRAGVSMSSLQKEPGERRQIASTESLSQ